MLDTPQETDDQVDEEFNTCYYNAMRRWARQGDPVAQKVRAPCACARAGVRPLARLSSFLRCVRACVRACRRKRTGPCSRPPRHKHVPQEYATWLRRLAKIRRAYAEAYRNEDNETMAAYGYEVRRGGVTEGA